MLGECVSEEERILARKFQQAAQGGEAVEEFLKRIAAKLADEVSLWEPTGNPNFLEPFAAMCHKRVEFILSDELGMARIQSMRSNPNYESWFTLALPFAAGEITAHIHVGVKPVWWEVLGWTWASYEREAV